MLKMLAGHRWIGVLLMCAAFAGAQEVTLTARVALTHGGKPAESHEAKNVVVWLTPEGSVVKPVSFHQMQQPRLVQRNKSFEPHLLVVPVGSVVAFPNHDPFFHNVFSLSQAQSFDLGSYPQGQTRKVTFNKEGKIHVECAIHPEMRMVIEVAK